MTSAVAERYIGSGDVKLRLCDFCVTRFCDKQCMFILRTDMLHLRLCLLKCRILTTEDKCVVLWN